MSQYHTHFALFVFNRLGQPQPFNARFATQADARRMGDKLTERGQHEPDPDDLNRGLGDPLSYVVCEVLT